MDDQRSRAAKGYLEARIRSASPGELISLLLEALAREVRRAAEAAGVRQQAARGEAIGRALGILGELRTSLNHGEGERSPRTWSACTCTGPHA